MEDEALKVARELRSSWFLSRDTERPAGCRDPALRRCHRDSECADGFEGAKLVCLLNFADPEEQRRGICAREGSCYQHRHCDFNNTNKMCTGAGECVEPRVRRRVMYHQCYSVLLSATTNLFSACSCTVQNGAPRKHTLV